MSRLFRFALVLFASATALASWGQVRYKVYDSGVNFDPSRISQSSSVAGQDGVHSFAYSRTFGLSPITPLPNKQGILAEDVNRLGSVVGTADKDLGHGGDELVAFIWDRIRGTRELADFGYSSDAYGINDLGDVVGRYFSDQDVRGFVWHPSGSWETLNPIYGGWCGALKINNRGEILGYSKCDDPDSNTSVIWRPDGSIVNLGNLPGQWQNFPDDLNNRGYVCGGTYGNLGSVGFLWAPDGNYSSIVNPYNAAWYIDATGLNDMNYIIGSLTNGDGWKGYIRYPNGAIKLLNDLLDLTSQGWDIQEAYDINNTGQISAVGYKNGQRRGVLLQPVLGLPVFGPISPP